MAKNGARLGENYGAAWRLGAGFEIQKTNLSPASSRKWQVHSIIAKYQKLQIEVSQWQVSTAFCSKNSSYVSFEEAC